MFYPQATGLGQQLGQCCLVSGTQLHVDELRNELGRAVLPVIAQRALWQ
jgi:hypothetical protein